MDSLDDHKHFPKSDFQSGQEIDDIETTEAAVKLRKVYRSYRTRRNLADATIVTEELWWQAIDYARLNRSTTSFFNFFEPEKAVSRWNRVSWNASKVGKGLGRDAKARKLAFQHWIEAIDPRHRYGHNLNIYFDVWCRREANEPFFYWLDVGEGKDVEIEECSRSRLSQQCIQYLGPQEREDYEYIIDGGKMIHKQTGYPLDTHNKFTGSKWIFVMSTFNKLYVGEKMKGKFHHSSFLAGGVTLAAGRLVAECGKLKSVSAYSGHYRPTDNNLSIFLAFLQNSGVNLDHVQSFKDDRSDSGSITVIPTESEEIKLQIANKTELKESATNCQLFKEERQCSLKIYPSTAITNQRTRHHVQETLQRIDPRINKAWIELALLPPSLLISSASRF